MLETEVKKMVKALDNNSAAMIRLAEALEVSGVSVAALEVPADNDDRVSTEIPGDPAPAVPVVTGIVPNTAAAAVATPEGGNGAIAPGIIPTPGSPPPPAQTQAIAADPAQAQPGQPTGALDAEVMQRLAKCSQLLGNPFLVNQLCQQIGVPSLGEATPQNRETMAVEAERLTVEAGFVL